MGDVWYICYGFTALQASAKCGQTTEQGASKGTQEEALAERDRSQ